MEETSVELGQITFRMVTAYVKLSKLQLLNIFKARGAAVPAPDDAISPELLMLTLLADMLERLVFLRPEQRTLILDVTKEAQLVGTENFSQLAFVDGYCTWTGNTGFLKLDSGEPAAHIPAPPMETISYNLAELYRRGKYQIEKRSGMHAKRQDSDRDVEEPADIRDSAPDGVS
jgi:hypothetical protein